MANILEDVQQYVVGKLSADWQLSGCCQFLAESIKDIDYEIKNALGRQGIVGVCMTPKATYAGKFEDLFLAWTLEELEIDIVENVTVNRGKKNGQWMTGQQIALRVFDVLCPLSGEFEGQFSPVSVEEGEDNGLVVNKCVLKALVYGEHGDVPQPEKPITYQFVKLLDQPPPLSVQPHDGWMWSDDGQLFFYAGHEAHKLGDVTQSVMSAYVESQISSKAEISSVPTKTSDLSNDSGFITANDIPAIPTKTSQLSNDSGFIQQNGSAVIHDLTCDQLVANQAFIAGYATVSDLSSKADLSAVPTKTSELSNDSGFITLAQVPTPSYIEDATGNRINANLSCIYIDDTAWEMTDPSSNKHILEYVGFIQSYHTWECVEPENIKLVLTYANDWALQVFTWQEIGPGGDHDWVLDINGSYNGDSDITTIPYFVNAATTYNYSAQRPVTKHLTLATKEYVDSRLAALEARIAALEGS